MQPLANLSQLQNRIPGGIPSEELPRAEAALEDASALVRDVTNETWHDQPVPQSVVMVVCAVARRVLHNPYGMQSETMGGYTWRNETAGVYLTNEERAVVLRAAGKSDGVISIETELHYGFHRNWDVL